ncbi:MAG TPA: prephenate dehydratase domain-containing protein, partial [Acidimicrobiia bacterium]|nr:prephenate dehydratase domain-containing protein [Acidimicrobiia bacterium]
MARVAYFGPAGTFTEEALLSQADLAAGTRFAHPSVPDVIAAVERGDADGGVVPIENMIEGSVSVTLDTLAFDSELLIQRE